MSTRDLRFIVLECLCGSFGAVAWALTDHWPFLFLAGFAFGCAFTIAAIAYWERIATHQTPPREGQTG